MYIIPKIRCTLLIFVIASCLRSGGADKVDVEIGSVESERAHHASHFGLTHCNVRTAAQKVYEERNFVQLSGSLSMVFLAIMTLKLRVRFPGLLNWVQAEALVTLTGLCLGGLFILFGYYACDGAFVFKETIFNSVILPPILFNLGFRMDFSHMKYSMRYFLQLGVVGFTLSAVFFSVILMNGWDSLVMDYIHSDGNPWRRNATIAFLSFSFSIMEPANVVGIISDELRPEKAPPLLPALNIAGIAASVLGLTGFFVTTHVLHEPQDSASSLRSAPKFFAKFVWQCSVAIVTSFMGGTLIGLATAVFYKVVNMRKLNTWAELSVFLYMGFGSFFVFNFVQGVIKWLNFPPHLVTFLVGAIMGNISWYNVSPPVKASIHYIVECLSSIAELYTYMVLGSSFWVLDTSHFTRRNIFKMLQLLGIHYGVRSLQMILFVLRVNFIPGFRSASKDWDHKINMKQYVALVLGSTTLGHVAYGLAVSCNEENKINVESIVWFVVFTTVVGQGCLSPMILKKLTKGMFIKKKDYFPPPDGPVMDFVKRGWKGLNKLLIRTDVYGVDRGEYLAYTEEQLDSWDAKFIEHAQEMRRLGLHTIVDIPGTPVEDGQRVEFDNPLTRRPFSDEAD